MSNDYTWFKVARGWRDNPIFSGDFSRGDAWLWLIENAAWKECRVKSGKKIITLQRGQLCYSIRFLAEKWGWSPAKVQRFLDALKTDTMIDTVTDTFQMVITICNYSKYQDINQSTDTLTDTLTDTRAIQERYKEEEVKNGGDISALFRYVNGNLIIYDSAAKIYTG